MEKNVKAPFVCNAFSFQMLDLTKKWVITSEPVDSLPKNGVSAIGHEDTARVLGLPCNRVNVKLKDGDSIFVAQLTGGRLPEGATTLPDGFHFTFVKVTVHQG